MSRGTVRRIALLEPLAAFGLIMLYIWQVRSSHRSAWLAILAGMVISHLARHENTEVLGFRRRDLRECLQEYAPLLAFIGLAMVASGILLQTTRSIRLGDALLAWA